MAKRLFVGPAGSGKTYQVLSEFEQVLKASNPLESHSFFILPSAEHTERIITVLLQHGLTGFFHRRITTLSDLIAQTFGAGHEGVASNVTRYLLLREVLDNGKWEAFQEFQNSSGFLNVMLNLLSELKESLISEKVFRSKMNALKLLEPDMAEKYEALAGIYEVYQTRLSERGLRDRQDGLAIYKAKKEQGLLKQKHFGKIWLDGFFDFSELQLAYLRELSELSEDITITLTWDPGPARHELFEAVRPTRDILLQMGFEESMPTSILPPPISSPAKRGRIKVGEVEKGERVNPRPQALIALEKNIFSESRPKTLPDSDGITIFETVGTEGEIEMIARAIETMHQSGEYRFSDFAILMRQIGDYESIIRSVFSRCEIPVDIHERERLKFSPMIQAVAGLLKIFREDWKRHDLLEFLKSSYVHFVGEEKKDFEWANKLEHWGMKRGIYRGREAWLSTGPDEDPIFIEQKQKRLQKLAELEDKLRQARRFSEIKQCMSAAVCEDFGIFQRPDIYKDYARRDAASFKRFEALLNEIEASFKSGSQSQEISLETFTDRFLRLVDLDLYSLHERDKNRVQVYDISLARQKEYRVVFVAGLLEKRFPVQIRENPVLSDWERGLFNGCPGEGTLKERLPQQRMERYLFYLAVTRAKEKLFLSYPRLDLEGKQSLPSYYVQDVRAIFKNMKIKTKELGHPYPEPHEAISRRELEMGVMGEVLNGASKPETRELVLNLAQRLLKDEASGKRFDRAFYEVRNELKDPKIAALGAFRATEISATRLEEYAKCSFKYYANQVLRLVDPEEDQNVMTRGIVLHQVLEKCFTLWAQKPKMFSNRKRALETAFEKLDEALRENPLLLEKKYQYDLEYEGLREMLERFIEFELERLETSPLKPRYFEYSFGKDGDVPPLIIEDGQRKISIKGQIDRIDVDAENKAGLIIDYKRTAVFKRFDLEFGTALQLPIYIMVLEKILNLKAAGGELYSLKELENKGFYHSDHLELFPGLSKKRMILEEEKFRAMLEKSTEYIRRFSREMEQMKIPVRPRECPDYCNFSAVCRIEKWKVPIMIEEIQAEDEKRFQKVESGS